MRLWSSKYRGDKWDDFFASLPFALVNHINGNAIYNLNHPLFNEIVYELEIESSTAANSIPFDYRISQMILEAQRGITTTFHDYANSNLTSMENGRFNSWKERFDLEKSVRETSVIGNYASTNMVPEYFDVTEFVVHGAKIRSAWENNRVGVSCSLVRVTVKTEHALTTSFCPIFAEDYTCCIRLAG